MVCKQGQINVSQFYPFESKMILNKFKFNFSNHFSNHFRNHFRNKKKKEQNIETPRRKRKENMNG